MSSKIERKKITIPTYPIGNAEPLPLFFEKRPYQGASGKLYPIPYVTNFSDEKRDVEYDGIVLENDYIKVDLLPEIGGKINRAYDKTSDYDFIYYNKVIKPAMVGLAGPWVSGGIEFNWPQHHRPTTFMPTDVAIGENGKEKYAYMGEVDYFHNMKGMVKVSVDDDHSYVKAEITVYNCTAEPHPFMWWANLAVEVNDDYKIVFPPDVECVNDHDRRAVLDWPVAKGVYKTARPFDYGDGTDIHSFNAVKVPCSFLISKGQSESEFVSGYDAGRKCGVVTVANHHVAPGKKLWTWGDSKFGAKWCANLTDDGSKYVELMTGCYTDNQPDFTWIAPFETKTFEQYWYPVKEIGETKAADKEMAINLERTEKGAFIGVYSTSARKNCRVTLTDENGVVFETTKDISPKNVYTEEIVAKISGIAELTVTDECGNKIISYKEYVRGNKEWIEPRLPAKRPSEIETVEELYLNGAHLVQYKHFAYKPEDYFMEGLRRDPGDIRCNKAMGDYHLTRGDFKRAIEYYNAAIKRLTLRNFNPYDTEPYYSRALCHFYLGELKEAYDDAYLAIWSYPQRSAGYYLLAKIEALQGRTKEAVAFLDLSLETNTNNLWAHYVKGKLIGNGNIDNEILAKDPLFFAGLDTEKNAILFANELMQFGFKADALAVLTDCRDGAMKYYYLGYVSSLLGNTADADAYYAKADACDWQCEFPSKKESIAVLKAAATPMASYYLGCILYNFERFEEAAAEWEKTVAAIEFAPAYRNLSLAYFDHMNKKKEARVCLEKALELAPWSDRIFYELTQMHKSLNLPLSERIALFEKYENLAAQRDDCTLNYSILCTVAGDYDRAKAILMAHNFHTYEGGEGNLTAHHAWLQFLVGKQLFDKGSYAEAFKEFEAGLTFPLNYGEEKNYFVNDAPLYLMMAECAAKLGDELKEKEYLALADTTKGAPTIHTYFQCKALEAAGNAAKSEFLSGELIAMGENRKATADVNDYYGVGSPAYPPFGYDIVKAHNTQGNLLLAFGNLAKGDVESAKAYADAVKATDVADFSAYLFGEIVK
ncbi:MAG: DUF5107 domain-containing protein [Clostridia bacterium]|nr:DUF5107 domain-containing protein [Clostridia bacterium]